MSYKFVKVRNKKTGTYIWLFEPNGALQVIEHWQKYPMSVIREGFQFLARKIILGKMGNCSNDFERAVEAYANGMNTNIAYAIEKVKDDALFARLQSIEKRTIYLNSGIQVIIIDDRFCEIEQIIEKDALTFPDEEKPKIEDVRFIVWDGGTHYYAKIGKIDVVDSVGRQKWNTKAEAMKAAEWYINENW